MRILTPHSDIGFAKAFLEACDARNAVINQGVTGVLHYPNRQQMGRDYGRLQRFLRNHFSLAVNPHDTDEPRAILLVSGPKKKFGLAFSQNHVQSLSRNKAEEFFGKVMISQALALSHAFPEFDPVMWRIYEGDRGPVIGRPHLDNGVHRKGSFEKMKILAEKFGVTTRLDHVREAGALSATISFGSLGTVLYPTKPDMLALKDGGFVRGLYTHAQNEAPKGPCIAVDEGDVCVMRAIAGWNDSPEKLPQVHAPYHHHFDDDPPMNPRGARISAVDFSLVQG